MKEINFISGMPRSGSTLLCNILCQNPKFHATQTSGLCEVLLSIKNGWENVPEHRAHKNETSKNNVLKSIFNSYYLDIEKPIIFDKSRNWLSCMEFLENLLDKKVKVIVTIRDLVDILASVEKLHRETSKIKQAPGEVQNAVLFQTIEGRCDFWCRGESLVGSCFNVIQDAINRGFKDRMHFVDYNKLTKNPKQVISEIYDFFGESYFNHDFNYVEQVTQEDDEIYGYVNLHKIKNKVEFYPSQAKQILGEKVYDKYKDIKILN